MFHRRMNCPPFILPWIVFHSFSIGIKVKNDHWLITDRFLTLSSFFRLLSKSWNWTCCTPPRWPYPGWRSSLRTRTWLSTATSARIPRHMPSFGLRREMTNSDRWIKKENENKKIPKKNLINYQQIHLWFIFNYVDWILYLLLTTLEFLAN